MFAKIIIQMAVIMFISLIPINPYLNVFIIYKIGLNKDTFCQNTGRESIEFKSNAINKKYLQTKRDKLGHYILNKD